MNKIYFFCGNARTFSDCFDSAYENVIKQLFTNNDTKNTYVLFYLKCDDPGPKGQINWNFSYKILDKEYLICAIEKFKKKYTNITFVSKILDTNEISDEDLLNQIKQLNLYIDHLGGGENGGKILRALHCHYNIERCGELIEEIEKNDNLVFDYYIYIRPDLFFVSPCKEISNYSNGIVSCSYKNGNIFNSPNIDHYAIIPNVCKESFFFDRMKMIRNNETITHSTPESIYLSTIKYEKQVMGQYEIKRK
jgi:hypothetical protein